MEIWKDIKGYEGAYQVSNFGNIKSTRFNRILRKQLNHPGYYYVMPSTNGIRKSFLVHRLVLLTFGNKPKGVVEVNHIDGVKTNNHLENLEWCTSSENSLHSYRTGLQATKLNQFQVQRIRLMKEVTPALKQNEMAKIFNVAPSNIRDVLNKRCWGWV